MGERTTTLLLSRERLMSISNKQINDYLRRVRLDEYEVTIAPPKFKRTSKQNKFYWYLVTGIVKHTGTSKENVHKDLKRRFLDTDIETETLNCVEMAMFIDRILPFAKDNGTYGPEFTKKYNDYMEAMKEL